MTSTLSNQTTQGQASEKIDVVVALSYESIADIVRRGFARPPDRLLAHLIEDPSVRKLMIVCPFRSGPIAIAKKLMGRTDEQLPANDKTTVISPYRLARKDPASIPALERTYRRFDRIVERAVSKAGMSDPVFISFHPIAAGFVEAKWASTVTYYARDDWAVSPRYSRWFKAYREAYRRIRASKRRIVAVSDVLLQRLDPQSHAAAVANGIDEKEWTNPPAPPAWFADLPQPRFLYVGTLDSRLDTTAVKAISSAFPDGSVVLAGPLPEDSAVRDAGLDDVSNVHIVPSQSRAEVVGLVHASECCLLTHNRTPLTEAMSPLKLYEYLAGGRPVAAIDLTPVFGIDSRVVTYSTEPLNSDPETNPAVKAAQKALESGPMTESERLAFIGNNAWTARHREVIGIATASGPTPSNPIGE